MYKRPKISKHQRPEIGEKKSESIPPEASFFAQPAQSAPSPELPNSSQSIEFAEPLSLAEDWYDSGTKPLPSIPKLSDWQAQLREIEWDLNLDVWESCPYD